MKQRFLIVDDARISRLRLRAALESLGPCEVTEVPNLKLGKEAAASGEWSAVFCDLLLPDGDGFSLLEALAAKQAQAFVYSCRVTADTRRRAEDLGVVFLEKPLDESALREHLRSLVVA